MVESERESERGREGGREGGRLVLGVVGIALSFLFFPSVLSKCMYVCVCVYSEIPLNWTPEMRTPL